MDQEVFASAWRLCELALNEALGVAGDVTSMVTIPPNHRQRARFVAAQDAVVAGLPAVIGAYAQIDTNIRYHRQIEDGETVKAGETICEFEGRTRSLLAGEMLALNFLQRLSGIATLTRKYVQAVSHTKTVILDTNRTLPGWRLLEKYAVEMGGGQSHRLGLYDAIVIGAGHVATGSITQAVQAALANPIAAGLPILVSVRTLKEFEEACKLDISRILMVGMTDREIANAIKRIVGEIQLEFVGRLSVSRAKLISEMGVDFIGVVDLTQNAPPVEFAIQYVSGESSL